MFWIRSGLPGISVISGWFTAACAAPTGTSASIEDAREALLQALGDASARRASLRLRIQNAPDAPTLWHLRPEVMNAVAQVHGEAEGRRRVGEATGRFEGLVSEAALTSPRPGIRMASTSP